MSGQSRQRAYVSMQDVAVHAQVSKATVSKVLNNRSDVSVKARDKVLASCQALGYRLNPNVQDLLRNGVAGHTHDIAFVLSGVEFANPSYAGMLDGISRTAENHNLHLILARLSGTEKSVYDLPPALRDRRVAGILLSGVITPRIIALLRETGLPYVIIGNYPSAVSAFSSSVELHIGNLMHLILERFKAVGRKRIAMFLEDRENHLTQQCFSEFKNALKASGLPFNPEIVFTGKGGDYNAFYTIEPVFQEKELPFDAIICLNYSASQEIACQIVAHLGPEKANEIIMATIAQYPKSMLIPTLFFMDVPAEIAVLGVELLLEILKKPETGFKSIAFTPKLLA